MRLCMLAVVLVSLLRYGEGIIVFPAALGALPFPAFVGGLPVMVAAVVAAGIKAMSLGAIIATKEREYELYGDDYYDDYEGYHYYETPHHEPPKYHHGIEHQHSAPEHHFSPPEHHDNAPAEHHRRKRRSDPQMAQLESMLASTISQFDSQGCLTKLICYLNHQEKTTLSQEEMLLIQFFAVGKTSKGKDTKEEQHKAEEEQCGIARAKCPLRESDLQEMYKVTQGCANVVL